MNEAERLSTIHHNERQIVSDMLNAARLKEVGFYIDPAGYVVQPPDFVELSARYQGDDEDEDEVSA